MTVERFQRQPFEQVSEPRVPAVAQLVRMLSSLQTGVLQALAPLYLMPFVRGVEVSVGPHAAGSVTVLHKLGRKPRGYLVTDFVRGSAVITDCSIFRRSSSACDERVITLYVTQTFESLTLWVW